MSMQPILGELEMEAANIRRHFDAIPEDKLSWKPHEKSMTLGQLANHIALTPGNVSELMQADAVPAPEFALPAEAGSRAELMQALDASLAKAKELLGGMTEAQIGGELKVMVGDQPVATFPKAAMARGILLNHIYHHRGQLSVYLRLLDVDVPATYGNSADENPFG